MKSWLFYVVGTVFLAFGKSKSMIFSEIPRHQYLAQPPVDVDHDQHL
jgi:hypothetical protein